MTEEVDSPYDLHAQPARFEAEFRQVIAAFSEVEAALRWALEEAPELFPVGEAPKQTDIVINTLGRVCAEEFREIQILCAYGLGNAAGRLLRCQFERVVTIGYLVNNPGEVQKFIDHWDAVRGRHLTHLRDALGGDIDVIPAEDIDRIRAKAAVAVKTLPKDGSAWSPLNVPDMAARSGALGGESLRRFYYECYFVPSQHVHATLESTEAYLDNSGERPRWNFPQRDRAARMLELSHMLIVETLEMTTRHFSLPSREVLLEKLKSRFVEVWRGRHGNPEA